MKLYVTGVDVKTCACATLYNCLCMCVQQVWIYNTVVTVVLCINDVFDM
ncbi:Uncharacterized protein BM_BM1464 [Brugia malayi]|uniref:Bm1464 n=1 Tax=Brugia malayi TaxID=6279 RepID=A0A0J9XZT5_BRUMA|nr:Uncharacterized protein BM_BM1464 [Brugia malayi]CDP99226.1 Bm1464 [Brugia malayi]VIO91166.1 Uncharacterized protein BM_BM1464 [Brugia malayi]